MEPYLVAVVMHHVHVSSSPALHGGVSRWLRVCASARRELASHDQSVRPRCGFSPPLSSLPVCPRAVGKENWERKANVVFLGRLANSLPLFCLLSSLLMPNRP
jgi:hypothetical protein